MNADVKAILKALETFDIDPGQLKWHYVRAALAANKGNVSETSRRLGVGRRSIQRIVAKRWRT